MTATEGLLLDVAQDIRRVKRSRQIHAADRYFSWARALLTLTAWQGSAPSSNRGKFVTHTTSQQTQGKRHMKQPLFTAR